MPKPPTAAESPRPLAAVFDAGRVRRGQRVLLGTTLVLAAVALAGAWLRGDGPADSLGGILYAMGLSGLVGFGTNWLAIKMLFHPRRRVLGLQGVIPRKRAELAGAAAALIEERLISGQRLQQWLQESGMPARTSASLAEHLPALLSGERLLPLLRAAVPGIADNALPSVAVWAHAAVAEKVKDKLGFLSGLALPLIEPMVDDLMGRLGTELRSPAMQEKLAQAALPRVEAALKDAANDPVLRSALEAAIDAQLAAVFASLDVKTIVEQELLKQSDAEIEQMADAVAADQLVFLQVAGGVLGMVAGLALIWPWLLVVLALPLLLVAWYTRTRTE